MLFCFFVIFTKHPVCVAYLVYLVCCCFLVLLCDGQCYVQTWCAQYSTFPIESIYLSRRFHQHLLLLLTKEPIQGNCSSDGERTTIIAPSSSSFSYQSLSAVIRPSKKESREKDTYMIIFAEKDAFSPHFSRRLTCKIKERKISFRKKRSLAW